MKLLEVYIPFNFKLMNTYYISVRTTVSISQCPRISIIILIGIGR